jgi:hypothetical protein
MPQMKRGANGLQKLLGRRIVVRHREMKSPTSDTCVMCGRMKACSRDHVPPKCIFPDPRPSDLVTVPACTGCNMHRSGLDEQFKVFLGLTVGYHLDGDKSYRVPVLQTLAHNRRLRSDILTSMRHIVIQDPLALTSQSALAISLNKAAHDTVVERTVRGLYFHHTGRILGDRYPLTVQWLMDLNDELYGMTNDWSTGTMGDPALVYKYTICTDDPSVTVWVLQFFQKTWSIVISNPDEGDVEQAGGGYRR